MPDIKIAFVDWLVLVGYLVIITAIGVIAGLKVKSTSHYFLGSRALQQVAHDRPELRHRHARRNAGLAGRARSTASGVSGIWYQWKNLFATPFYWLIAPLFRRIRRTTMAEMIEDRYGPWMGAILHGFRADASSPSTWPAC